MRGAGSLMTAQQLAAMLGISVDWVYAETRAGRIPHVPLGRYRRYRRETIEDWLSALEAETIPGHTKRPRAAQTAGGMAQGVVAP